MAIASVTTGSAAAGGGTFGIFPGMPIDRDTSALAAIEIGDRPLAGTGKPDTDADLSSSRRSVAFRARELSRTISVRVDNDRFPNPTRR